MNRLTASFLLFACAVAGCTTKSKAREQAQTAFIAGQRAAMAEMRAKPQGPSVRFIGNVRFPYLSWTEGMTLAQAIIAAQYQGADPREIVIRRSTELIRVKSQELLSGDDVLLLPDDIVDIRP